jgi:hypothetical protein
MTCNCQAEITNLWKEKYKDKPDIYVDVGGYVMEFRVQGSMPSKASLPVTIGYRDTRKKTARHMSRKRSRTWLQTIAPSAGLNTTRRHRMLLEKIEALPEVRVARAEFDDEMEEVERLEMNAYAMSKLAENQTDDGAWQTLLGRVVGIPGDVQGKLW